MKKLSSVAGLLLLAAGCSPLAKNDPNVKAYNFTNGDFELGTFDSWTVTPALWGNGTNNPGFVNFPPKTFTDLKLTVGTTAAPIGKLISVVTAGPTPDALTTSDSLKLPFDGTYSAQVNDFIADTNNAMPPVTTINGDHNANILQQTMTVASTDVDATDNKVHIRFAIAPVLNNPVTTGTNPHTEDQQPYFFVEIMNVTTSKTLFSTFNFSNQPGVPWIVSTASKNAYKTSYTNWQTIDVAPGSGGISVGDSIEATVVASGCSFNAHFGEVYVDDVSTAFTVPTVSISAPTVTNAGTTLTYTVTAHNGTSATAAATNAIVDFTTPILTDSNPNAVTPNTTATTFNAVTLPTTNAANGTVTCTAPTKNTAGTVKCTIPTIPAGGTYTYTIVVNVPVVPGGYTAPDYVNEGTYDIHTDQKTTPTNGALVQTLITNSLLTDLQTTVTDGTTSVTTEQNDTYTLTVTNNGPTALLLGSANVTDTQPADLSGVTWTCAATGGATCTGVLTTSSGSGAINQNVSLPVNGTVTYTVTGKIVGPVPASGLITYSATATPSAASGVTQSVAFDNSASDTDTIALGMFTLGVSADPSSTGTGTITSNPAGISCGATCSETVSDGAMVALTATPDAGSTFTGWSGGGCGTANPCTVTVTAATSVTATFAKTTVVTSLLDTSNSNSQSLPPGGTADFHVKVTIPKGTTGYALTIADLFPTDMSFTSNTTPVIAGTLTCTGTCTTPTQSTTGQTRTLDFGTVSCSTAADCTIDVTFEVTVATTATRGETLVDTITAAGQAAQSLPTITVIEPNLTVTRTESPSTDIARSGTTTVTVTLANDTGGANSPAVDPVITLPTPSGFTASNYMAGTCPADTATFGANAVFTPTDATSSIGINATCTFTYTLTESSTDTGNATVTLAAGTATSQSISGNVPPAKQYTATIAATTITTSAIDNGGACASASECTSDVCDTDNLCGYKDGDGPCTTMTADKCRSGQCSSGGLCLPASGCLVDGDCMTATQFCDTMTDKCTPKLSNGMTLPTYSGHTPALNGMCGTGVGAIVCTSGVCDATKCGYATGDGTCTTNAQCQSNFCSKTGKCGPTGGCLEDADCDTSTQYCDTGASMCAAKLPNSSKIPTVANHTPDLAGTCTTAVAMVVCTSAVCDTKDNECGYADGDGTCTTTTGPTVCRSKSCKSTGVCGSGCAKDSDCDATQFCDTSDAECSPKLPNGSAVPTIAGHTPALTGVCSTDVGTAVCSAAVCDTADNLCGYKTGDGPCTTANAMTVCRDRECGSDGLCGLLDGQGPCTSGDQCRTGQCNSAGLCGPEGTATPDMSVTPTTTGQTPSVAGGGFTCAMGASTPAPSMIWLLLVSASVLVLSRRRRT